jgi:hypothetical protein
MNEVFVIRTGNLVNVETVEMTPLPTREKPPNGMRAVRLTRLKRLQQEFRGASGSGSVVA